MFFASAGRSGPVRCTFADRDGLRGCRLLLDHTKAARSTTAIRADVKKSELAGILVATLVISALVGLMLVAYLSMVRSQHNFSFRSQIWNCCITLCEGGVEEALAHLNHGGTTTNFAINGWVLTTEHYRKSRSFSDGFVEMAISNDIPPTITVEGFLRKPLQSSDYISRTVRVKTKFNQRFPYAILSKSTVTLSGNKAVVDSFNSENLLESTLGQYDALKRTDRATVATVSSVTGALNVGDVDVYGRVATGPGGTVSIAANGVVGSTLYNSNPLNLGTIEAERYSGDVNVTIDPSGLPSPFNPFAPGPGTVNGTNYAYVLGEGDYRISNINLSSSAGVIVTGKARIHVEGDTSLSSDAFILINSGASVEWYSGGAISVSGKGAINASGLAKNFSVIGLSTCTSISYSGQAVFIGTVYAPSADVKMSGSTYAVGALVGKTVSLSGDMSFHYDEALRGNPRAGRYLAASWQEL